MLYFFIAFSAQSGVLYQYNLQKVYCMDISVLDLTSKRISELASRGIKTVEDVQEFFPRKYYDFSQVSTPAPGLHDSHVAIVGVLNKVASKKTNNILMLQAKIIEQKSKKKIHVQWIGAYYMKKIIQDWENQLVIVCGKLTYNQEYGSYHIDNPMVFDKNIESNLKVYPVYPKMQGISTEFMTCIIDKALLSYRRTDILSDDILKKYRLLSINEALFVMHHPRSIAELEQAKKRLVYDKLLSFALQMELMERNNSKGTIYNSKTCKNTLALIKNLPFTLSESQQKTFNDMQVLMQDGRRINALIQGDVASGKTIISILMMFLCADSGYQSVLMAPTAILAKQHYKELSFYANKYGYHVAFLGGKMKAKEKRDILSKIKNGYYHFVVGTHSVIGKDVEFQNLALTVIDEEHKFGVEQRDLLMQKAKAGVHNIIMSATPIPRTMANSLYGNSIQVYDLEVPEGRQKIQTCIFSNEQKIFEFIHKEISAGRQAYVVCPLIEDTDSPVESVEITIAKYKSYFEPLNVCVGSVTGKMSQEDADYQIELFNSNQTQILISTTVIEVGVNVPNASVIVINSAERFGLAQLHQLRGRVGRGKDKAYCILKSKDITNERLQVMCNTTNGYAIAEADMKIRGTGNLLGKEQSGNNEYIDLLLKYPNMFQIIKKDAKKFADMGFNPFHGVAS